MRIALYACLNFAIIVIAEVVKWWAAGELHSLWVTARKMIERG